MKDLKLFTAYALFSLCLLGVCLLAMTQDYKYDKPLQKENEYTPDKVTHKTEIEVNQDSLDWGIFTKALIWVESKGDSKAVGSKDDVGVLQIRKPIVDDCNRILGCEAFTLEDRLDSLKSVEMFNIIQDHYNPQHDYHWALKLWNSRAPLSYHRKVMDKYNEIKENL